MLDKNQLRIFQFLWNNPSNRTSIAEMARKTGLAYAVTWKTLKEFEKKGIVSALKDKAYLYSLNLESELCFNFWELRNALKKQELGEKEGYEKYFEAMNYLNENTANKFLVLFGSVARKEAAKQSDLDVLLLVKKDFNESELIKKTNARYFIQTKITKVTEKELQKYLKQKRQVYQEMWRDGIVWNGTKKYVDEMKKLWV